MNYRILIPCLFIASLLIGTVSADTLIIPSIYDGYVQETVDSTWPVMRDAPGHSAVPSGATYEYCGYTVATTTDDEYTYHRRCMYTWNTSIIPDDATINSVKSSVYGQAKGEDLGAVDFSIIDAIPPNPRAYVDGDYTSTTFTRMAPDVPYADFGSQWVNHTFNEDGIAAINKTGDTPFMYTHSVDVENDTFTWASSALSGFRTLSKSYSDGAYNPFLTIEYTPGGAGDPPVASFTCDHTFLRIPQPVTCTDTSTNTPTSWNWSWGDGTFSTTEIPTHKYTKREVFDVTLTATNDEGSDESDITQIGVTGYETYT